MASMPDPDETCIDCIFCVEHVPQPDAISDGRNGFRQYTCKRFPQEISVATDHQCGEFELKE